MAQQASPLPDPNEKLVRVFETEQESEAMVVRGLLQSAGIDCEFGESENSTDVLPFGWVGIMVRQEDAQQARQVIADYQPTPEQERSEEAELDEAALESPSEDRESEK